MTILQELPTPSLIVDLDKLESNIDGMAARARRLGVALRPHVKTHKCLEIAGLQRAAGCRGLTVSTLAEARIFADHGFDDLTWAFPLIPSVLDQAARLAAQVTLRLLVDSTAAIDLLEAQGNTFHVWLKVDCGYHRAGVDPAGELVVELVRRLHDSRTLRFDGLLTHSGHAYKANSRQELLSVANQERQVMTDLAERLGGLGLSVPAISVGSTPAMSVVESLAGVDEARPGNYVFHDQMQVDLGSCAVADCAATVLTSVVSSQPGADHCVTDAGALVLSKDSGSQRGERPCMGRIFADYQAGAVSDEIYLTTLSQEHGLVNARLPIGERLRILPNHSCLTVACFDELVVVRADQVVDRWKIWRQR